MGIFERISSIILQKTTFLLFYKRWQFTAGDSKCRVIYRYGMKWRVISNEERLI